MNPPTSGQDTNELRKRESLTGRRAWPTPSDGVITFGASESECLIAATFQRHQRDEEENMKKATICGLILGIGICIELISPNQAEASPSWNLAQRTGLPSG